MNKIGYIGVGVLISFICLVSYLFFVGSSCIFTTNDNFTTNQNVFYEGKYIRNTYINGTVEYSDWSATGYCYNNDMSYGCSYSYFDDYRLTVCQCE